MSKKKENPLLKPLFFGCDMLEFTLWDIKKDTFFSDYWTVYNLNDSNSNRAYIDFFDQEFSYQKLNIRWYDYTLQFSIVIENKTIDCFMLCFWTDIFNWKQKSSDKVVFYSSFFILEKLWYLNFTLYEFYNLLFDIKKGKLHRIDIALDVTYDIKYLNETIFKGLKFQWQIWDDLKHPEFHQTYYIWQPKNSQNRRFIIRIYDKILDTFKKKKVFLYPHLQNNFDVRRIELELRPENCRKYHNYDISDFLINKNKILENIYLEYINKKINEDYKIENISIPKLPEINRSNNNLLDTYLQLWHIPKNYITQWYGYIRTIKETTWYNWLFQLLIRWLKYYDWKNYDSKFISYVSLSHLIEFYEKYLNYLLENWIKINEIKKVVFDNLQKEKFKWDFLYEFHQILSEYYNWEDKFFIPFPKLLDSLKYLVLYMIKEGISPNTIKKILLNFNKK